MIQFFARGTPSAARVNGFGFICLLAMKTAGCGDGQATPDYQGIPLATLAGTIFSAPRAAMPSDLTAGLSWSMPMARSEALATSICEPPMVTTGPAPIEASVSGSFPARFKLVLFGPPPTAFIEDAGFARAKVVVFEKGSGKIWGSVTPDTQLVYITGRFMPGPSILEAKQDCLDWAAVDYWDRNPHAAGYYLVQATRDCVPVNMPNTRVPRHEEAAQGLATELTIALQAPAVCPTNMFNPTGSNAASAAAAAR